MKDKIQDKDKTLLKLTFAIKTGLTVDELLSKTLPHYIKVIDYKAALIIENKEKISVEKVFPEIYKTKNAIKDTLAYLKKQSTQICLEESYYDVVKTHNGFHHIFKLSDYGYIILVKTQDISSRLQTDLIAVFQFYGQTLMNSQYLEDKRLIEQQIIYEKEIESLLLDITKTYININLDEIDNSIN